MTVEPVTPDPPQQPRRVLTTQRWRQVTMLHWPLDPAVLRPLLPPGVEPDTLDGTTYVGLVAFLMDDVGVLRGPGVPYLGRFPETNVRVYSVDERGRRGVVFLSMDAGRLLPALVGRSVLRLPYLWSSMSIRRAGERMTYTCGRRPAGRWGAPDAHSRIVVRPGETIRQPSPLEHFLTARWALHAAWGGRLLHLPNAHPRWPLRRATLLELDDSLVMAAGLPDPGVPPVSVLYSGGVSVRFGRPSAARPSAARPSDPR